MEVMWLKGLKLVLMILTLSLLMDVEAKINSRFPGFSHGDYGYSFVLGEPIMFRYQKWTDWKHAHAYGGGYEQNGKLLTGSWTYYFYQLSEDDRWRGDAYVGTIMYGFHLGLTGGVHLGDEDESSRVGFEAGVNFEYLIPDTAWSLRFEVTPVLYIAGQESAGIHGGVGLTYYFGKEGEAQAFNRGYITKAEDAEMDAMFDEDDEPEIKKKKRKKRRKRKVKKKRIKKKKKSRRSKDKFKTDDDGELDI